MYIDFLIEVNFIVFTFIQVLKAKMYNTPTTKDFVDDFTLQTHGKMQRRSDFVPLGLEHKTVLAGQHPDDIIRGTSEKEMKKRKELYSQNEFPTKLPYTPKLPWKLLNKTPEEQLKTAEKNV